MNLTVLIVIRFADNSTRTVTVNNLDAASSAALNIKSRIKRINLTNLNGILVGKDGSSAPSAIDSARTVNEVSTVVWTKDGGLQ